MGKIFKYHFREAKGKLEEKLIKMIGSGFGLKRKRKLKKAVSE